MICEFFVLPVEGALFSFVVCLFEVKHLVSWKFKRNIQKCLFEVKPRRESKSVSSEISSFTDSFHLICLHVAYQ